MAGENFAEMIYYLVSDFIQSSGGGGIGFESTGGKYWSEDG